MKDAEFICNDENGPSKWYYKDGRYYRVMSSGELRYSLEGKNLANPALIEAKGKQPQGSTFAVWNHYQAHKED